MTQKISDISEFELIEMIEKLINSQVNKSPGLTLATGDDTAVFNPEPGYEILITCDSMVEGRHFIKKLMSPIDVGRRAMVMNISDIGAMGGTPLYAVVSLGLTPSTPVKDVEDIYKGFFYELAPFNACIAGGNITGIDGPSFIDITLTGKVEKKHIALRSTAKPSDVVMVTGFPGQSAAGCHILQDHDTNNKSEYKTLVDSYLRPEHRAGEGKALAESGLIRSMIDLSDGLAGDLNHICQKSGVGAEIYQNMLPLSESLGKMARHYGLNQYDLILGASDDYELIFTCLPERAEEAENLLSEFNCPVSQVGRIVHPDDGSHLILENGAKESLDPSGWDHFSK
ncbi:thiamine-phosphate kinase [Thermodesulfobacteriota bacterium]